MERYEEARTILITFIRSQDEEKVLRLTKEMIMHFEEMEDKDESIYGFFTKIYDEIFHDILFEKIRMTHSTKRLLETLALPVNERTLPLKVKLIRKLIGK